MTRRRRPDQANAAEDIINEQAAAAAVDQLPPEAAKPQQRGFPEASPREPGDERSYPPLPNPFGSHHDNQAGVELSHYSDRDNNIYETWLKFRDGKPSDAVRAVMKENGFRWSGDAPKGGHFDVAGAWTLDVPFPTRNATRLKAERVFAKVVSMILEEKGLAPAESKTPF